MKRRMTFRILRGASGVGLLLGAMCLSGCVKEVLTDPRDTRTDGTIRINADIDAPHDTKAAMGTNSQLTDIHFIRRDVAGTTPPANYTGVTPIRGSREPGGKITFATPPTYSLANDNAWFVAYWPGQAATGSVVTWTVDGRTDILLSDPYNAGTYSAPLDGTGSTKGNPMRFRHQLAQLEVVCMADPTPDMPETAVRKTWGKLTGITILNTPSQALLGYATPATVSYATPADIPLGASNYVANFPQTGVELTKASPAVVAAGMFAPDVTTASTAPVKLRIFTEKFPAGIEVSVQLRNNNGNNSSFEKGKRHTVTLTFKSDVREIEVHSTRIADWGTGYQAEGEVQGPGPIIAFGQSPYNATAGSFGTAVGNMTIPASTSASYNDRALGYRYYDGNSDVGNFLSSTYGEMPYARFEVSNKDDGGCYGFVEAWNACRAKSPIGKWRLPRAAELLLIYINSTALSKADAFSMMHKTAYWSATESDSGNAWIVGGETLSAVPKITTTDEYGVRCIRETK